MSSEIYSNNTCVYNLKSYFTVNRRSAIAKTNQLLLFTKMKATILGMKNAEYFLIIYFTYLTCIIIMFLN
jgi:hypothetical protein